MTTDRTTGGAAPEQRSAATGTRPPIEVGMLVVDDLRDAARTVFDAALSSFRELLEARFPDFRWEFPVVERRGPPAGERVDPGELLFEGIHERDQRHWDFALVVTVGDLLTWQKPYALAVPSRSTGVAVLSLARIVGTRSDVGEAERERDVSRFVAVLMHVLGDLTGVYHSERNEDFMFTPRELSDLDQMRELPPDTVERLQTEFAEIADTRLEEREDVLRRSTPAFYLRATWHGLDEIGSAVLQARPWELPFRLSRLTAAAAATTLVLTLTAEAWDLGLRQSPLHLVIGAIAAIAVATVFVLRRQSLLLRRSRRAISEQIVVMNVSIAIVVLLGMLATWCVLWAFSLLVSWTLFDAAVITSWAPRGGDAVSGGDYVAFAAFVATAGTLIGALGASFEGRDLVRYVVFADEET